MSGEEMNERLEELDQFLQGEIGGTDNISNKETQQKITNKFIELGIFNMNFTENYFQNEVSGAATLVLEDFTHIFKNGVTKEEKINQLLNNPNIISLVSRLGQPILPTSLYFDDSGIEDLLIIAIEERIPYEKPLNSLMIIQQILTNIENDNINLGPNTLELINNIIESTATIDKEETEKAKEIMRKIIDLAFPKNKDNLNQKDYFSWNTRSHLLTKVEDDDFKIENIMTILRNGHYNDEIFAYFIGTINNIDKRLELIRKLIDYSKENNKPYFQSFMLSALFEPTKKTKIQNSEEFIDILKTLLEKDNKNKNENINEDYFINLLKTIVDDEKIREFVKPSTIESLFENIEDQPTLIRTYETIKNDPLFQKYLNGSAILAFLKKLRNDRQKIEFAIENVLNNRVDMVNITEFLSNEIKNKTLLLDKELMEPLYTNENFFSASSIAYLASPRRMVLNLSKVFSKDENSYVQNGNLDEILEKYKTLGFINEKTLNQVYDIESRYNPNLKKADINNRISSNKNAKDILEFISTKSVDPDFNYHLNKFLKIYPNTRLVSLPDLNTFSYLTTKLCENFNLRIWNQLIDNELFSKDITTKSALIEIIAISGLFEKNDLGVEARKQKIIDLFGNKNNQLPISESDLKNRIIPTISVNTEIPDIFEQTTIKTYRLKEGIIIPEDLSYWLSKNLTESEMKKIRKETGNIGHKLNNFIAPYTRSENGWILRNEIQLDRYSNYLKEYMTNEEYKRVLESEKTPLEVLNFLNPYEQREIKAWKLKKRESLNESQQRKYDLYIKEILDANLLGRYNSQSIHRMFDGLDLTYNEEFFEFFIENQEAILSTQTNQSRLKYVQKGFSKIKKYFAEKGKQNPNYNDMINYLDKETYPDVVFGNEEFAKASRNALVSKESYKYYENILKKTRNRHLTTVPRHNNIYEYIAPDGTKYEVMAKVLRADDPFNMLVGEANYTNCCQRHGSMGEPCMRHAATSQNGGIFATYLMKNGEPNMLTQSWFWTNESRACLDDIEATELIKNQPTEKAKLYEDIAMFAIEEACKEMLEESKKTVEAYIEQQRNEINNSNMSEEDKKQKTERLKIDSRRMRLHEITVGGSNNKISTDRFNKTKSEEESYGPKGYGDLYRDSYVQYVIAETGEEILTPDDNYEEKALYRDERRVEYEAAGKISYRTLKKITDIEKAAHKEEMTAYIQNNQFVITEPSYLAELCNCSLNDLRVISGEDWYYVYSDRPDKIEIYDFAKKTPRIEDEGMEQFSEMVKGFEKIVSDSILTDENGEEIDRKPICADLREDTSYLLFLQEIRRGKIEQIGDDIVFPYNDITNTKTITQEEQDQILENKKEIRKNQNPDMIMHRVSFKPTDKMVEKILEKRNGENKNVGRSL